MTDMEEINLLKMIITVATHKLKIAFTDSHQCWTTDIKTDNTMTGNRFHKTTIWMVLTLVTVVMKVLEVKVIQMKGIMTVASQLIGKGYQGVYSMSLKQISTCVNHTQNLPYNCYF